jgi:hypothetical protein
MWVRIPVNTKISRIHKKGPLRPFLILSLRNLQTLPLNCLCHYPWEEYNPLLFCHQVFCIVADIADWHDLALFLLYFETILAKQDEL